MNLDPGTCKSCGAAILWGMTAAGKRIPLNTGVVTIIDDEGITRRGRVSHFADCPQSAAWSRGKASTR